MFWGFLTDRFSRKNMLAINKIGTAAAFFLYGFIPNGSGMLGFAMAMLFTVIRELFSGFEVMCMSYLDDTIEEEKRSAAFGLAFMFQQMFYMAACIVGAFLLRFIWHEYFFIIGGSGIVIGIIMAVKGKESKRASERKELKGLLKLDALVYDYKITKETLKKTILSRTNFVVFIEGLFTQLMLIIPFLLFFAYVESPPYNLSPEVAALIAVVFGAPGSIIGSMVFAKASDKWGKKNVKNRIYVIIFSLICLYLICTAFFFIPLTGMTLEQGKNFFFFLSFPAHWFFSFLMLFGYMLTGLFGINQKPLIQKLNLPEAQGLVSSANSFLEIISVGIAGLVSGAILVFLNNNYQVTSLVLLLMALIGASLWFVALKNFEPDIERVSSILKERAGEIEKNEN